MLRWFRQTAPIRVKLLLAFGIQAGLILICAVLNRSRAPAGPIDQSAASLDGITDTVPRTVKEATQAREVVGTVKTDAERSGTVMRNARATISGIEKSSQQITQIIEVLTIGMNLSAGWDRAS